MLASITPLGERGRRSRWSVTIVALLTGAALAGAGAGALAGVVGSLLLGRSPSRDGVLIAMAVALFAAAILDLRPGPAPGPHRQVDERWLDEFRGWVYGLGFGVQLGAGVVTVISSAATYVALLAAFLLADPAQGALVLGCSGAIRGATPLLAAGVTSTARLLALHARIDRWREPVRRAVTGTLLALMVLAGAGVAA